MFAHGRQISDKCHSHQSLKGVGLAPATRPRPDGCSWCLFPRPVLPVCAPEMRWHLWQPFGGRDGAAKEEASEGHVLGSDGHLGRRSTPLARAGDLCVPCSWVLAHAIFNFFFFVAFCIFICKGVENRQISGPVVMRSLNEHKEEHLDAPEVSSASEGCSLDFGQSGTWKESDRADRVRHSMKNQRQSQMRAVNRGFEIVL